MYPTSKSADLTPEQTDRLDDTFFEANPASYWRARIDGLLREPSPVDYLSTLSAQVTGYGLDVRMLSGTEPTNTERELQRGLDAFALRHHLAESLVRLVHTLLFEGATARSSVWAALTTSPFKVKDIVDALGAFDAKGEVPATLFLPAAYTKALPADPPPDVVAGVLMHWRWVKRAMQVLVSEGLDANVGNNKLKHGLAVRPHSELRVAFMTEPLDTNGNVRLSAVQSGLDIIDAGSVEFLERLPRTHEHGGSWEVSVLNLRPAPLIAEALMLSTVWASAFAAAASNRFSGPDAARPKHPGLVLGPPPEAIVQEVVGLRQPLTISPKSGSWRGGLIETPTGTIQFEQTGTGTNGVIVDG